VGNWRKISSMEEEVVAGRDWITDEPGVPRLSEVARRTSREHR
jgi:hypothetical protein